MPPRGGGQQSIPPQGGGAAAYTSPGSTTVWEMLDHWTYCSVLLLPQKVPDWDTIHHAIKCQGVVWIANVVPPKQPPAMHDTLVCTATKLALSPGQEAYQEVKSWECWAATPLEAPLGPLKVMGTLTSPADM